MKPITKKMKLFFYGVLIFTFITPFSSIKSQSNFIRNDSFDFQGMHELWAASDPNNFNLAIISDSDFPFFRLHVRKNNLNLFDTDPWYATRYKVSIDGSVVQDWTTDNEKTISYNFPDPPNGVSANHTFSIQVDYVDMAGNPLPTKSDDVSITIFSKPRVYVDSDNNSFIQLRNEDATTKIPVLMVEGFDPLNEKFPEEYYNLTWELVNTDLYPNGYEVFILNFNDGGRDLRLNANVLLKAIEKVHEICPNYKIAVAGLSMGGPITRYALAKKEGEGGTHDVGLFLSYDSPQYGAHVSPGLQDWIYAQSPSEEAIRIMQDNLNSVAAKQMLLYNTYDRDHIFFNSFYNQLNGLNGDGYPNQSYNVSVSNGNFQATYGQSSVGRHLLTLKINDNLIYSENAVNWDCYTGSKINDLTTRRYGDIFTSPFLNIWYELQFIFNPAYQPTWSALDLVGFQHDDFGNLIGPYNTKFDDYMVQTNALYHSDLSSGTRNKIMEWLNKNSNITVNYDLPEGGSVSQDNYQVQILHGIPITVQPKTVNVNGKQITYTFWKWEDGNTDNPRTFYTSHDISHTVSMKGTQLSNNTNAYSNNSQRKFVRTPIDGHLHNVYESMGHVWYERSTDNGTTWQIMNNGQPIDNGGGRSPSLDHDQLSGYNDNQNIYIVYQEYNGATSNLKVKIFLNGAYQFGGTVDNIEGDLTFDAMPVISKDINGRILVAWRDRNVTNYYLYYRFGQVISSTNSFYWYNSAATVPNTDNNSLNPTISSSLTDGYADFHFAWAQNQTQIKYNKIHAINSDTEVQFINAAVYGSASGFTYNYKPSIIAMSNNSFRLTWIGESGSTKKVVTYFNNQYYNFGSNSTTASISLDADKSIIAYDENNGTTGKFATIYYYTAFKNLNINGHVQVCDGSSLSTLYANGLRLSSTPYAFFTSSNLSSLPKAGEPNISTGKQAVVAYEGNQFYYLISDIDIDGNRYGFEIPAEEINISKNSDINNFMISEPLDLKPGSQIEFNVSYGFTDLTMIQKLENGKYVNFKIKLVDVNDANTSIDIDNIEITKDKSISKTEKVKLNTGNIKPGTYRIKLIVDSNLEGEWAISNVFAEDNVLNKENDAENKEIEIQSLDNIDDYSLSQNYPNPFNPSTIIKYKLPENGFVILKVYDILGKEVKTLVNEFKPSGRYEITFDGSNLASGVYVYKLDVNNFSTSRKFILMK